MHFFHPIQQSATHIYHSALPLSPKSSMFCSMSLPEKTRITEFYERPENWGFVFRTITSIRGGFTCMTTIGRGSTAKIAAACDDGTVSIYDSVTGVLRLSLSPPHPIQSVTGSPDGSVLFCTHRTTPSITIWDIQTGGLVHTFALTTEVTDTAVSLNGRYLACGLSDGTVNVWEVATREGGPVFRRGSPITCLCWLAPEERLMVANETSVHIRDAVAGSVLVHRFGIRDPIYRAVYSHQFNLLAVMTSSGSNNSITIINPQTGSPSISYKSQRRSSCFSFSQTIKALLCGGGTHGLELINMSTWPCTSPDFPAMTITSVLTLSNGTVVVNVAGSGIQLLNLDMGHATSEQPVPPTVTVRPFDRGGIIAIFSADSDSIILLETATMSQILTIPCREKLSDPTARTVALYTSAEDKVAVHCFARGGEEYLELWKPDYLRPQWTVQTNKLSPSAGSISSDCTRLVTLHNGHSHSYVCVWNMGDGRPLVTQDVDWSPHPLDVTFGLEYFFRVDHDTHRILYRITTSRWFSPPTYSVDRLKKVTLDRRAWKEQYCVDDDHKWVVSGSQKICWIPSGYIASTHQSHCWAGSSLVMVGQDGTLRKLKFRET